MVTGGFILFAAIVLAVLAAIVSKPRAIGWWLVTAGALLLTHAGISLAIIWFHGGLVPTYVDYYLLFATVPAGILLVALGLAVVCARSCAARLTKHCAGPGPRRPL